MTISTTTNKIIYAGLTGQDVFGYNFKVLTKADMNVYLAGVIIDQGDWSIDGLGNDLGGNVTLTTPLAVDQTVTLLREIAETQETDYQPFDAFPAESHEAALDKLTMITQQLTEQINRRFLPPPDSSDEDAIVDGNLTVTGHSDLVGGAQSGEQPVNGDDLTRKDYVDAADAALASDITDLQAADAVFASDITDLEAVDVTLASDITDLQAADAALASDITDLQAVDADLQDQINSAVSVSSPVPVGGIIMFNAAFSEIPANFQLCDGSNGTPNMTDKFVYGTNTENEIGDTGGSANTPVVSHTHSIAHNHGAIGSSSAGTHDHHAYRYDNSGVRSETSGAQLCLNRDPAPANADAYTICYVDSNDYDLMSDAVHEAAGAHTHTTTVPNYTGNSGAASSGVSGSGTNIPPYVKLAYIQRMS